LLGLARQRGCGFGIAVNGILTHFRSWARLRESGLVNRTEALILTTAGVVLLSATLHSRNKPANLELQFEGWYAAGSTQHALFTVPKVRNHSPSGYLLGTWWYRVTLEIEVTERNGHRYCLELSDAGNARSNDSPVPHRESRFTFALPEKAALIRIRKAEAVLSGYWDFALEPPVRFPRRRWRFYIPEIPPVPGAAARFRPNSDFEGSRTRKSPGASDSWRDKTEFDFTVGASHDKIFCAPGP
jgi:hypothetical protein